MNNVLTGRSRLPDAAGETLHFPFPDPSCRARALSALAMHMHILLLGLELRNLLRLLSVKYL